MTTDVDEKFQVSSSKFQVAGCNKKKLDTVNPLTSGCAVNCIGNF
jgi:hypothetical protein